PATRRIELTSSASCASLACKTPVATKREITAAQNLRDLKTPLKLSIFCAPFQMAVDGLQPPVGFTRHLDDRGDHARVAVQRRNDTVGHRFQSGAVSALALYLLVEAARHLCLALLVALDSASDYIPCQPKDRSQHTSSDDGVPTV